MSPCPSPETLGRLTHASSSASRFGAMEAHVEACPDCQNVLERLAADSSACEDREPEGLPPREQPPMIPGFVIERELGRGGMGVVYQAWQPQLARRVAIKVVSASALIGAEDRRRWLHEARAIGRVRHRNVLQLHEAGEQDGCLYLVLDLIMGGSLAERVTGPLPARVAVELMLALARAVDQIHKAGMLHLDIKPSNILLDGLPDGPWDQVTPMLADFGIARAGDDPGATATGPIGVGGTPSFMAPEQIAGDSAGIGPPSDVFALGATLYSISTGRPPFQAASVIETLDLVRTREPAPPRTLVPGLPRDVETIALTCLRKDPRRRYASAGDLADDLQRWLDGFPIEARPVSKLEHAVRWCRRRPAFASLLAVFALTVASSLVGLLTLWRHAENALARAKDSEKTSSAAVRDLIGLLATTVDAPQMLPSELLAKSSDVVRDLTAKLRQDRGFAASNLIAICDLDLRLSKHFVRQGRYAESGVLLMDSLDLLGGPRRDAGDPRVDEAYARALMELGRGAHHQERFDESLVFYQRAERVLEGLVRDPRRLAAIVLLDESRRNIASLFGRSGLEGPRWRLLESHRQMLEGLSEQPGVDPTFGALAALVRSDLSPRDGSSEKLRAAIQRFPANARYGYWLQWRIANWIAGLPNLNQSVPDSDLDSKGRLDPAARADAVIRALESRWEALGVAPSLFRDAALRVAEITGQRGQAQRHAGQLNDARRTAACLSAFAQRLAQREPDVADYHLLLCEAFEQESKIAWEAFKQESKKAPKKVEDFPAIEEATRNALGAARAALSLEPRNTWARIKVAGLQDKLAGLVSEPRSSQSARASK
ncbi:MAG: protein kinase domain-containing protein [Isosphaeraceae bacterium]